ncbi:MAG: ATP-binding protein [Bacteroidota bacterium]
MEVTTTRLAAVLEQETSWFEQVANASLNTYFSDKHANNEIFNRPPPELTESTSPYAKLIHELELDFSERLVLILALMPQIKPQALDIFLINNQALNSAFSEFGGYKDPITGRFYPTLETACFVLNGYEISARCQFLKTFTQGHKLYKKGVLNFDVEQEFGLTQKLSVSNEYFSWFTTGKRALPQYSTKFPAKSINTLLNWDDLILDQHVLDDLKEIKDWLLHSNTILHDWQLNKDLKAGYRCLFYGPSGTGKTLAATLLGKETERPVFRVDLSLVVSKYIGETEKNLSQLFNEAENRDWILFFDEADALFGKRTQTKGANDRYANQEVAYLLQRIEDFSGLVILATNIQTNIDEAFSRRFQAMIHFPKPNKKQQKQLWKRMFLEAFELGKGVDLNEITEKFDLSAGEMVNVLRFCALGAAKRNEKTVDRKDLIKAIQREYQKSNKTI